MLEHPTEGRPGAAKLASRGPREHGPSPAQAIGRYFRTLRQSQDLSQEQLAALTRGRPGRVSRAMISAIERGVHMPGLEVLLTLSQALHISPTEILERLELHRGEAIATAGLATDEIERLASEAFWAGDHRRAVACYDAILLRLAEDASLPAAERDGRIARTEVRRATALRRCGALAAARAAVERAIVLSAHAPELQAQGYIVLTAMLIQVGCLPLARDASERAVELAAGAEARVRGWAWIERGEVLVAAGEFRAARAAFLEARRAVREARDLRHEIHVEGNLGACHHGLGRLPQATARYARAVALARRHGVPVMEAVWLVELGRAALDAGQLERAESCAQAALRQAAALKHTLTMFRAEWLRHEIDRRHGRGAPDRHRVAHLKRLFCRLDEHRGIREVQEFRSLYCSGAP